jgi:anti-sigma factor RsiW
MSCRQHRRLLSAFLDGELASRGEVALREHLKGCAACDAELAGLEALRRVVAVPARAPDPGFLVRFRARRDHLARGIPAGQPWRWLAVRLLPMAAATAAAAALAVVLDLGVGDSLRELEVAELRSGMPAVTADPVVSDLLLGADLAVIEAASGGWRQASP